MFMKIGHLTAIFMFKIMETQSTQPIQCYLFDLWFII